MRRIARTACNVVLGAAAVAAMLMLAGCMGAENLRAVERPVVQRAEASRLQLLTTLEHNLKQIYTLQAKANIVAVDQNVTIPASPLEAGRQKKNKPYKKRFLQADVNGQVLLARDHEGNRNVRFSGEIFAANAQFMLLGKNDAFWVAMPNLTRDPNKDEPRGTVFFGTAPREGERSKEVFSMRPQDVWDLLMPDEVLLTLHRETEMPSFMETWPDYYIITFLNPRWPAVIYSKIWIERENLTMMMHQLYDASGEVVVEGRFGEHLNIRAKGGGVAKVPSHVQFVWPRDNLVMNIELSNIKLNEEINARFFEPFQPRGYDMRPLQLTSGTNANPMRNLVPGEAVPGPATPEIR